MIIAKLCHYLCSFCKAFRIDFPATKWRPIRVQQHNPTFAITLQNRPLKDPTHFPSLQTILLRTV